MNSGPIVIVFAGPNGSGKSTLTKVERVRERAGDPFPNRYINPDDVSLSLKKSEPNLTDDQCATKAFWYSRELRRQYREQGLSFALESVFSHPSNLRDLELLREAGYRVELNWVTTADPEINVGRVCSRRDAGGHFIKPPVVRKRYIRGMRFLPRAVEISDRVFVYDNSQDASNGLIPCFEKEEQGWVPDSFMPSYLQRSLVSPLQEREAERKHLGALFNERPPLPPDEEAGVYNGPLLYLGKHYAIQQHVDGADGVGFCVQHDLCVLPESIDRRSLATGVAVRINYGEWYLRKPS